MKCIILAAGYATRLYPLTENFPKPLLPVGGKPILDWLIDDLKGEADEFIVVTNHKFTDVFHTWATKKDNIRILDDGTETNETRLGAVKDIAFASRGLNDDVLVMAGDNVLDFSLVPFIRFAQEKGTSCVMCHEERELKRQQKTAIITVDDSARITSYEEKPQAPKGNLAVPPFYYYQRGDLNRIMEALDAGCGYDAPGSYAAWLSGKTTMHAWKMSAGRFDIGSLDTYEEAVRRFG